RCASVLLLCRGTRSVPIIASLSRCFFCAYCRRRDLHSFPTRRSSDLLGRDEPVRRGDSQQKRPWPCRRRNMNLARRAGLQLQALDRKSTRLNSSHLGISYAVFCLKKKKISGKSSHVNKN